MKRLLIPLGACGLGISLASSAFCQNHPAIEHYQISTGQYTVVGGIVGEHTHPLPNTEQAFLEIIYNFEESTADLRILGADTRSVFLSMTNGHLDGGAIEFFYLTTHPYAPFPDELATLRYTLQLGDATVRLQGAITSRPVCCDIPYEFRHENVEAIILPNQPPDPAGLYAYEGFSPDGTPLVEGWLLVTNRTTPLGGQWRLRGVDDPADIGPQIGQGNFGGTRDGNHVYIDLNPMVADNNVILNGTIDPETKSISGDWLYATLLGPQTNGTFQAAPHAFAIHSGQWTTNGFALHWSLPPGLICLIEYSGALGGGVWHEAHRFTTQNNAQTWVDQDASHQESGRFYRLRVVGLLPPDDPSPESCARRLLAEHFQVPEDSLQFLGIGYREFRNSCCGCFLPPDIFCADVITQCRVASFSLDGEFYEVIIRGDSYYYCPFEEDQNAALGTCP